MRKITIKSITLRNWRGEKERTTTFHTDAPTYICGDNGLGKSRHFDAFCWLLFGKDSQNRKDYELRTYDGQHNVLHKCECSVEATLCIDGTDLTIKREFKENWVKPRGQVEEVFSGNVTECTWNGTPVRVGDFQKRINGIIDENVFRMITNPSYFVGMKWQLQRETLMQMAGTLTDEQIAGDNQQYKLLLVMLSGKSLSDFRKEIAAEKKRLKNELDQIEPRIDQTQKMMPEKKDWDKLEAEQAETRRLRDEVNAQLVSIAHRDNDNKKQIQALNRQVLDLQNQQTQAVRDYRSRVDAQTDAANETNRAIQRKLKEAHEKLSALNIDKGRQEQRTKYLNDQIASLDKQLGALRDEWYSISKSQYDGSDICPHCGQKLPENMVAQAHQIFDDDKDKKLRMNSERGKSLSQQKKSYQTELDSMPALSEQINAIGRQEEIISDLEKDLQQHPAIQSQYMDGRELPEVKRLQQDIDKLTKQIEELSETDTTGNDYEEELTNKLDIFDRNIERIASLLNDKAIIEKANVEIAQLEERGKQLAQQIAAVEKLEFVAQSFTKKKIAECEKRIDSKFSLVHWQLFDHTQDGNEFECCVPIIDGTPYGVANRARQFNAGLDIINALCAFNNVSAPIFVDNAESYNHFIGTPSQMIYLRVTGDKELVIK